MNPHLGLSTARFPRQRVFLPAAPEAAVTVRAKRLGLIQEKDFKIYSGRCGRSSEAAGAELPACAVERAALPNSCLPPQPGQVPSQQHRARGSTTLPRNRSGFAIFNRSCGKNASMKSNISLRLYTGQQGKKSKERNLVKSRQAQWELGLLSTLQHELRFFIMQNEPKKRYNHLGLKDQQDM